MKVVATMQHNAYVFYKIAIYLYKIVFFKYLLLLFIIFYDIIVLIKILEIRIDFRLVI